MMKLYLVSTNPHKFREAREMLEDVVELERMELDIPEIQSDSLEEIVSCKASQAYKILRAPLMVEDAGLFIHALKGFPGPYSNYAFKTIGIHGILKLMQGIKDRRAEFRSAVGLCLDSEDPKIFIGKVSGLIADSPRGDRGFGFDPIFLYPELGICFGEMELSQKNLYSHRAEAFGKLRDYLRDHLNR